MTKTFYDEAVEENGKIKGKIEGKIEDILEELGEKGILTEAQKGLITKESDLGTLKKWFKVACKSASIEEFFKAIQQ